MEELARDPRQGVLIGGSDVSVLHKRGTTAWMIATHIDLETNMHREGPVSGNPTIMHSTKSKRGVTIGPPQR